MVSMESYRQRNYFNSVEELGENLIFQCAFDANDKMYTTSLFQQICQKMLIADHKLRSRI